MTGEQIAILRLVHELLTVPERWTQGVEARDQHGEGVWNTTPTATCWCLVGAIRLVSDHRSINYMAIEKTLASVIGCENISDWNDTDGRRHQDVIDLIESVLDVV